MYICIVQTHLLCNVHRYCIYYVLTFHLQPTHGFHTWIVHTSMYSHVLYPCIVATISHPLPLHATSISHPLHYLTCITSTYTLPLYTCYLSTSQSLNVYVLSCTVHTMSLHPIFYIVCLVYTYMCLYIHVSIHTCVYTYMCLYIYRCDADRSLHPMMTRYSLHST